MWDLTWFETLRWKRKYLELFFLIICCLFKVYFMAVLKRIDRKKNRKKIAVHINRFVRLPWMDLCGKYYLLGAAEGSWFTLPRSEEPLDLPHGRSWQAVLGSEHRGDAGGGRRAGGCLCRSSPMNHNKHSAWARRSWLVMLSAKSRVGFGFAPPDQSQQSPGSQLVNAFIPTLGWLASAMSLLLSNILHRERKAAN